jgi:hypothetical protein
MTERTVEEILAENERLKLELENAQLRLSLAQAQNLMLQNPGPETDRQVLQENPKAPGGAPVPRAPLGGAPSPPKPGDEVRVTCRSGATIKATGMRCQGKIQKIQGILEPTGGITGGGGRRVVYVCQTCQQPWHVVY